MTNAEYQKRLRDKRKSMGLCIDCREPSCQTHIRCAEHMFKDAQRHIKSYNANREERKIKARKNKEYRRNNNMCFSCGTDLIKEDGNHTNCMNCREELYFMRI